MSFDRVANCYQWMEKIVFRTDLEKVRNFHLRLVRDAESILILGDGDGRFLKNISEIGTDAQIVSVDSSSEMIRLSQSRTHNTELDVRHVCQNFQDFEFSENFRPDLIFAHFFLDCFTEDEVILIVNRLSKSSLKSTKLVISDFFLPEKGSVSGIYRRILTYVMIRFFRLFCRISAKKLPNIPKIMRSTGWTCIAHKSLRDEFINSWVWELEGYSKRP